MKTSINKQVNKNALLLKKIREQQKELANQSKLLISELTKALGENNVLSLPDVTVIRSERERKSLDKKSLISKFGAELISQFEKITQYSILEVKGN